MRTIIASCVLSLIMCQNAICGPPLTKAERTKAAIEASMNLIDQMNEHMGSAKYRPRVTHVEDWQAKRPGLITIEMRSGGRDQVIIACECRVRGDSMHVDQIAFLRPSIRVQDHPKREDDVEALEKALTGYVKTFHGEGDGVLQKWTENKIALQKIGSPWHAKVGTDQFIGTSDITPMGIRIIRVPELHSKKHR